jgi:putative membrane protein
MPNVRRRALTACVLPALLFGAAAPAFAHAPRPVERPEPALAVVLLLIAAVGYAAGIARLRPHVHARRELAARAAAFTAGWLALALALLSPLDAAAGRSFAAHMVQHEILMLVAAPLLVLGRGLPTLLWALPHDARKSVGHLTKRRGVRSFWNGLTTPVSAWLLHGAALWLWHAPPFFNAALADGALHHWQHATFFVSALLFWHALLRHGAQGARGAAIFYLFTTTVHTGVLGALITFARTPLYAPFDYGLLQPGSLTPLEDQQLGGLIMWVPGALVYVGAALTLLARWLRESSQPDGVLPR